jgi:hypothetical protein
VFAVEAVQDRAHVLMGYQRVAERVVRQRLTVGKGEEATPQSLVEPPVTREVD